MKDFVDFSAESLDPGLSKLNRIRCCEQNSCQEKRVFTT